VTTLALRRTIGDEAFLAVHSRWACRHADGTPDTGDVAAPARERQDQEGC